MLVYRPCFTCVNQIECDDSPVELPTGRVVTPKFNAPMICKQCRLDPKKFATARKAMLDYFGWTETHRSGVPLRELNEHPNSFAKGVKVDAIHKTR